MIKASLAHGLTRKKEKPTQKNPPPITPNSQRNCFLWHWLVFKATLKTWDRQKYICEVKAEILKLSFPGVLELQENAKAIVTLVIIFLSSVLKKCLHYSLWEFRKILQLLDTIDSL